MSPETMAVKWLSLCEKYDATIANEIVSWQRKFNPEQWGQFANLITIKDK